MDRDLEPILAGVAPAPDEAPRAGRRGRRWPVLPCLGLTLAGVGLVAVANSEKRPSAEQRLDDIRDFVAGAHGAEFIVSMEERDDDPFHGERYSDGIRVIRAEGDLVLPARAHWVWQEADYAEEVTVVPDGEYVRRTSIIGGEQTELRDERWVFSSDHMVEHYRGFDGRDVTFLADAQHAGPIVSQVAPDLPALLDRVERPEVVDDDTIRGFLSLDALFEIIEPDALRDLDGGVEVELTSGTGGRLDSLVWTITMSASPGSLPATGSDESEPFTNFRLKADVRFSWDSGADVTAPPLSQVEPTPYIDEDALAAVDYVALSVPRELPSGLKLTYAFVMDESQRTAPDTCPGVSLSFEDPTGDGPHRELALSFAPVACAPDLGEEAPELRLEPYEAGPYQGRIHRPDDPGTEFLAVELTVGDVRIGVSSTLPEEEVTGALSDLVPFDLESTPVHRSLPAPSS